MKIDLEYKIVCGRMSDINEHLPVLKEYGEKVERITEFGLRGGDSTTAFLAARPKSFNTYDINPACQATYDRLKVMSEDCSFLFFCNDTSCSDILETDLLFIDSYHSFDQLAAELNRHHQMVKRYIIMHDTHTFGWRGEDRKEPGLKVAIAKFLATSKSWQIHKVLLNNNGLTILERK